MRKTQPLVAIDSSVYLCKYYAMVAYSATARLSQLTSLSVGIILIPVATVVKAP